MDELGVNCQMSLLTREANVYCLGGIKEPLQKMMEKWEKKNSGPDPRSKEA